MNQYYEKLINFEGACGLRELVDKWEMLSANLEFFPARAPILLPDLFVVSESDYTLSRFVSVLSDYLITKRNLMEFYGDVPCFDFMLNYHGPDTEFTEIRRLMDEVSNSAGFRTYFRGIVHIRIDAWVGHQEEQHFLEFIDYLKENTCNWLIILSVRKRRDPEKTANLEAFLSMSLRLERITLKTVSTAAYVEEIESLIEMYDFQLDESAKKLLSESIDILRENKYFDSSGTIRMLCSDIVYEMYSREIRKSFVITAQDLKWFAPDGDYIKRTLQKARKRKIGFS